MINSSNGGMNIYILYGTKTIHTGLESLIIKKIICNYTYLRYIFYYNLKFIDTMTKKELKMYNKKLVVC